MCAKGFYIFFITDCVRNDAEVNATSRNCGRNCSTAADCRRKRPCVCDDICGLSCINICKLQVKLGWGGNKLSFWYECEYLGN